MSFNGNEINDNETIKQPNNNLSEEDEEILKTLGVSTNNKKDKLNESLSKDSQKVDSNKENKSIIEEENEDKEADNKFIKRYISDTRLNGITFQSTVEENVINLAVSSLNMNSNNNISILSFNQEDKEEEDNNINTNNNAITLKSKVECRFPVSSILFSPHIENKNLLVSTSDLLYLYSYDNETISLKAAFTKRRKDYCGPLTACDWSHVNNSIVGVSSVDSTCSLWDLNKTEITYITIAHDKEVYDISLGPDEFTFMSTGADGSVRLFDSRTANSVNILFETKKKIPLTRIKWNLLNPYFILTVVVDKNEIYVLDQRDLSYPYAILKVHTNVVNNAIWAPQSNTNFISVSDDKSALIWDIYCDSNKPEEYIMKYEAKHEIENVSWGDVTKNWIGIIDGNQAEVLRIQ
jgi:WD repeat-containing protein 68